MQTCSRMRLVLQATPTARASKASPSTPVSAAAVSKVPSAGKMAPPTPAPAAGEEHMDNALSDLRELQVRDRLERYSLILCLCACRLDNLCLSSLVMAVCCLRFLSTVYRPLNQYIFPEGHFDPLLSECRAISLFSIIPHPIS